jgi:hypothetical protein
LVIETNYEPTHLEVAEEPFTVSKDHTERGPQRVFSPPPLSRLSHGTLVEPIFGVVVPHTAN